MDLHKGDKTQPAAQSYRSVYVGRPATSLCQPGAQLLRETGAVAYGGKAIRKGRTEQG